MCFFCVYLRESPLAKDSNKDHTLCMVIHVPEGGTLSTCVNRHSRTLAAKKLGLAEGWPMSFI